MPKRLCLSPLFSNASQISKQEFALTVHLKLTEKQRHEMDPAAGAFELRQVVAILQYSHKGGFPNNTAASKLQVLKSSQSVQLFGGKICS